MVYHFAVASFVREEDDYTISILTVSIWVGQLIVPWKQMGNTRISHDVKNIKATKW